MKLGHLVIAAAALTTGGPALAGVEAQFEGSVVIATRNDAAVPGDTGTKFSLVDDLSTRATPAFRLRIGYRFAERHLVSALYAPLQLTARGRLDEDINFGGSTYRADSPLLAVYRFDSYRLTYRYSVVRRAGLDVGFGVTGKVRDAETSLYGADDQRKTNTGFVPLLNAHVAWRPNNGAYGLVFDVDALAAPQGRAADVLLAATWAPQPGLEVRVGYRTLEGGADNDEVFSFAWLHYAVLGLAIEL